LFRCTQIYFILSLNKKFEKNFKNLFRKYVELNNNIQNIYNQGIQVPIPIYNTIYPPFYDYIPWETNQENIIQPIES